MNNLERIIGIEGKKGRERRDILREIGRLLFPSAEHPDLALDRVIKEGRALDTDQLTKLAAYKNISVCAFFSSEKWKARTNNGVHYFENGEYTAELNSKTWVTRVFHKGSLFHDELIHNGSITLSEYLKKLELLVDFNEGRRHTQRQYNTK